MGVKIVSSDLNGTLVHQHTMSDMIRLYIGQEEFEQANAVFKRQTSGQASMEEAFKTAGPLTRGLTLSQAVDYVDQRMAYVNGFQEFVDSLRREDLPFVINSTGYSVTIHAIRERIGRDRIHGMIGNNLVFGIDADSAQELRDDELEAKITAYCNGARGPEFDRIKAIGEVRLGITDEAAKASLINEYVAQHFPEVKRNEIAHIGDTMGDSGGILGIAEQGGLGIAFNYNTPLHDYLQGEITRNPILSGRIHFVDQKSESSDLVNVLPMILAS